MDTKRSDEERKARLEKHVFEKLKNPNMSLVQQSDFKALLRYEKRINHVAHFIISIFTAGFWLPVWFLIAVTNRRSTTSIKIDENGYITEERG